MNFNKKSQARRWILICLAAIVSLLLYKFLPYDVNANKGLALLVFMALLWLTEALPITISALLVPILGALFAFPSEAVRDEVTNQLLPNWADIKPISFGAALKNFANPTIFLFFGGFGLATALNVQKLDRKIAHGIISLSGNNFKRGIFGILLVCTVLSMWISNTATAAMMLPLSLGLLNELPQGRDNHNTKVFVLLAVAYCCSIGGIGTLVGSPPNAIASAELNYTFYDWLKIGLPVMIILLPVMLGVLWFIFRPNLDFEVKTGNEFEEIPWTKKRIITMAVFIFTALVWVFGSTLSKWIGVKIDDGMVGLFAVVLVEAFQLASWKELDEHTDWGVLLLFGGGLALSSLLQVSGASYILALEVKNVVGTMPPIIIIAAVAFFIIFLTEFTSNTASAALLVPVFATIATELGLPKETLVVIIGIGASCAFMLPVATPPNAIVFGTGEIKSSEMLKAGAVLNVVSVVVVTLFSYFFLM